MAEPEREWFEKDYYAVLGVAENATDKEITKAYRKLAREFHPDSNPGNQQAEERFKEISAAYGVVGDEDRRRSYDQVRRMGPMGAGFGGGFSGTPFSGGMDDLGDLLGGLFGRGAGGRSASSRQQPGADLEADLKLDFHDAVIGLETTIHLTSEAVCPTCAGNGSAPGHTPERCRSCGGDGMEDDNQGYFAMRRPCRSCGGRGSLVTHPCDSCRGSGTVVRPRDVKVRIPAGVADGQTIRLKGKGGPGRNGGPAGDLLVEVAVQPHERFGRKGDDLTVSVTVAFTDLVLGAEIEVPTLEGTAVRLRLRPGTASGSRHRVAGRGVSRRRGGREVTGDLIATVNVIVPTELSDAERSAIEALAAATIVDGAEVTVEGGTQP